MQPAILSCRILSRYFGKVAALEDVNLEIRQGEIFGLLGPNGAGKTTLIRCIMKLIAPGRGEICFRQRPLLAKDIRESFGFLPENFLPPANFTAKEFLNILAWGLRLEPAQIESALMQVDLQEQGNKLIKTYSRGMIQRLGLAIALLKQPEVIILDEPALGLDPIGQNQMLSLLLELNKQGKTIFFSSHILSQIEKVAHRIGILHQGSLKFTGGTKELLAKHNSFSLEEAFLKEVAEKKDEGSVCGCPA